MTDIPSVPYSAVFRCIAGCQGAYPLDSLIYCCPSCHGLLEVSHDVGALQRLSGEEWIELFDSRYPARAGTVDASGVWSKREWVYPGLDSRDIIHFSEGNTPLVELPHRVSGLGRGWIKQCGHTQTGSFKDLGMTVLVSAVKRLRRRRPSLKAVACASTGDTSAALAAYCARAGIPALILLPEGKTSMAQLLQPLASGAVVCALRTDFDGCMKIVQKLTEDGHIYLANSLNSLRLEGQKTLAIEICQQLGWRAPDWVVIPGGNLGNVSALGYGFSLLHRLGLIRKRPRIACAQAQQANPLYRAYKAGRADVGSIVARNTLATAIQIGNPVSAPRAVQVLREFHGVVEQASEQELADAAALADSEGMLCCPQTAVALACSRKLVHVGVIGSEDETVVISTANGLKFMDYKRDYHRNDLEGLQCRHANPHHVLEPNLKSVLAFVEQLGRCGLDTNV